MPGPREELLLLAALAVADQAGRAFQAWLGLVDLEQDLGWETVRLFPLAYHNLRSHGISAPVLGRFKGVSRRTWYESQQVLHRTIPAVIALQGEGIAPCLLDGGALALTSYPSPALRPVPRLDLLVRPGEVRTALVFLRQAGWRCAGDGSDDDLRFADHLLLVGPDDAQIGLHWRLLPGGPSRPAGEPAWRPGALLEWQGVPLAPLNPTDQLTRTILAGLSPTPVRSFQWIPDAVMLLRHSGPGVDWSLLQRTAATHRMTGRLALGCRYLKETFGAAVPEPVLNRLARQRIPLLERVADGDRYASGPAVPDWGRPPRGTIPAEFVRYLGWRRGLGNPVETALEFSHFLRYRWGLSGRRELLPLLFRMSRSRAAPSSLLAQR